MILCVKKFIAAVLCLALVFTTLPLKPGFCNRREDRDERGRYFFDEKSEGDAGTSYELFEEEKVRHRSLNPTVYCKFRVQLYSGSGAMLAPPSAKEIPSDMAGKNTISGRGSLPVAGEGNPVGRVELYDYAAGIFLSVSKVLASAYDKFKYFVPPMSVLVFQGCVSLDDVFIYLQDRIENEILFSLFIAFRYMFSFFFYIALFAFLCIVPPQFVMTFFDYYEYRKRIASYNEFIMWGPELRLKRKLMPGYEPNKPAIEKIFLQEHPEWPEKQEELRKELRLELPKGYFGYMLERYRSYSERNTAEIKRMKERNLEDKLRAKKEKEKKKQEKINSKLSAAATSL